MIMVIMMRMAIKDEPNRVKASKHADYVIRH